MAERVFVCTHFLGGRCLLNGSVVPSGGEEKIVDLKPTYYPQAVLVPERFCLQPESVGNVDLVKCDSKNLVVKDGDVVEFKIGI